MLALSGFKMQQLQRVISMLKELSNSYVDVDFNFLKIILLLWPTQNIFLGTLHILWSIAIQP
jgi:hypothetical protein